MKKIFIISAILFAFAHVYAQAPARTGRDYAVFFYVTTFKPGWAQLPETAEEATQLKTELENNFGFTCKLVPNPSKEQIRTELRSWNDRLGPDDQALFFFSMHGYYDKTGDQGYLVAADGIPRDPYFDSWLRYDDLRTDLARCKAKHVLLALDACYSGSFGTKNKAPDEPAYQEGADCAEKIRLPFQYTGRQYVTSGNKESKTPAKSLFASKFLEALRKGGEDGLIHFDDLAYWLGKVKSPEPENGSFTGHVPGGDFVFVRKGACAGSAPDLSLIEINNSKPQKPIPILKTQRSKPKTQKAKPKAPSPKSKSQISNSKIQSPKSKTQNSKPKIQSPKSKASKSKTQSPKSRAQNPKPKTPNPKPKAQSQKPKTPSPKSKT